MSQPEQPNDGCAGAFFALMIVFSFYCCVDAITTLKGRVAALEAIVLPPPVVEKVEPLPTRAEAASRMIPDSK